MSGRKVFWFVLKGPIRADKRANIIQKRSNIGNDLGNDAIAKAFSRAPSIRESRKDFDSHSDIFSLSELLY